MASSRAPDPYLDKTNRMFKFELASTDLEKIDCRIRIILCSSLVIALRKLGRRLVDNLSIA
jgi:hypothetical protein